MAIERTWFSSLILVIMLFGFHQMQTVHGQAPATATEADLTRYNDLLEEVKKNLVSHNESSAKFYLNGLEESFDWRDKWEASLADLERNLAEFRLLACRIYASDLEQPDGLEKMIEPIVMDMLDRGHLFDVTRALEKLVEVNPDNDEFKKTLGLTYAKTNRYEEAIETLQVLDPELFTDITTNERGLVLSLPQLSQTFPQEQEIRAQEREADDLPRVELETTRGKMVIELFENEAPETVANFISLVESGHYEGTIFHRVIDDFMAQGGGFTETNQSKPIDYSINDEFKRKDFRRHYRGSVSMANTGKPNSGSAQFFINLVATPFLDGRHTVFGRMIDGELVWQRLSRTHTLEEGKETPIDEALPDKIISAKVIRKRPHEYIPVPAEQ